MEFIRIENNVVVELVSTAENLGDGWVPVSLDGGVFVGADVRAYDESWEPLPLQTLVDLGVVVLERAEPGSEYPVGTTLQKIENNTLVPKARYDFAKAGEVELSELEYLDDDAKTTKTANSIDDLLALGKVDLEKATTIKSRDVRDRRRGFLERLDATVSNPVRWPTFSDAQRQALASYRQALLDVPQQAGFPWSVEWPEFPV